MSNNAYIQKAGAKSRQRQVRVLKHAPNDVAAEDYAYQQQRAIKNLVRTYTRAHPTEVIEMLREDGVLAENVR